MFLTFLFVSFSPSRNFTNQSTKAQKNKKDEQSEEVVEEKSVGVLGKVIETLARTGGGTILQTRVQFLDPKTHAERRILRNVKGNVRVGDSITLLETEREARRVA